MTYIYVTFDLNLIALLIMQIFNNDNSVLFFILTIDIILDIYILVTMITYDIQ